MILQGSLLLIYLNFLSSRSIFEFQKINLQYPRISTIYSWSTKVPKNKSTCCLWTKFLSIFIKLWLILTHFFQFWLVYFFNWILWWETKWYWNNFYKIYSVLLDDKFPEFTFDKIKFFDWFSLFTYSINGHLLYHFRMEEVHTSPSLSPCPLKHNLHQTHTQNTHSITKI